MRMTREKQRPKRRGDKRRVGPRRQRRWGKWLYIALPTAALLIGLGGAWLLTQPQGAEIQLAPVSQLPEKVRKAPAVVQEAYRFAVANPEILANLPCYCGCGSEGHTSDLDCFIERFDPDGSIVFGYHAFE